MWETKYNEMLAISSHQEHEIEQLQTANEKGRLSHTNVSFSHLAPLNLSLFWLMTYMLQQFTVLMISML